MCAGVVAEMAAFRKSLAKAFWALEARVQRFWKAEVSPPTLWAEV